MIRDIADALGLLFAFIVVAGVAATWVHVRWLAKTSDLRAELAEAKANRIQVVTREKHGIIYPDYTPGM